MKRNRWGARGLIAAAALVVAHVASGCVLQGAWTTTPLAQPWTTTNVGDVDCVAADDCYAVVKEGSPAQLGRLGIQHWDGASWTHLATVGGEESEDRFYELGWISCWATDACMISGNQSFDGDTYDTTYRWNGTSLTFSRINGEYQEQLECAAGPWCISFAPSGLGETQTWNGTSWDTSASDMPAAFRQFDGVGGADCDAARRCVLVAPSVSPDAGTALHVADGVATTVAFPSAAVQPTDVDCSAANHCVAVGRAGAALWDGSTWATRPIPSVGGIAMRVDCAQAHECIAVGVRSLGGGATELVVRAWWGHQEWAALTPPPEVVGAFAAVESIDCAPFDEACTIVGRDAGGQGLAVRYTWDELTA